MKSPFQKRKDAAMKVADALEKAEAAMVELTRAQTECGVDTSKNSQYLKNEISDYAAWVRKADWMAA
jgi:hypothetical protein